MFIKSKPNLPKWLCVGACSAMALGFAAWFFFKPVAVVTGEAYNDEIRQKLAKATVGTCFTLRGEKSIVGSNLLSTEVVMCMTQDRQDQVTFAMSWPFDWSDTYKAEDRIETARKYLQGEQPPEGYFRVKPLVLSRAEWEKLQNPFQLHVLQAYPEAADQIQAKAAKPLVEGLGSPSKGVVEEATPN